MTETELLAAARAKNESDPLTYDEAAALLIPGGTVHTFVQAVTNGRLLILGADGDRESALDHVRNHTPKRAGEMARGMGHGIVVFPDGEDGSPLFLETREADRE